MKSNDLSNSDGKNNNKLFKSTSSEQIVNTSQSTEMKLISEDNIYSTSQNLTKIYFKRWIILFIFCFISLLSAFNWIEYNIIQDVTIAFYNSSLPQDEAQQNDAVNWFSMVYMACYIPLVFPAMFLLDRKGLKLSCILGALLTTVTIIN